MATITRAQVSGRQTFNDVLSEVQLLGRFSSPMKSESPVTSPLTPPKDPNSPLVSTGSSVGPNGQNASSSVGASTAVNETG